jgi:excisionase family DNA binding protein
MRDGPTTPNEMVPLAVDFRTGAKLTSLSEFTLRKYVRDGKLRATKCGRRWLIPMEELHRLVHEGIRCKDHARNGQSSQ